MAEWLCAASNTAVHTYEVSPVFTIIESEVIAKNAQILNWNEGSI